MIESSERTVTARLRLKTADEGGRHLGIMTGSRPSHVFEYDHKGEPITFYVGQVDFDKEWILPGEEALVNVTFLSGHDLDKYLTIGRTWWLYAGPKKQVGEAVIVEI